MRYGIKYQTQPRKAVKNVVVNRSGNPGYYNNFPLLVSSQAINPTGLAKVNANGFVAYDHDDKGKCFDTKTDSAKEVFNYHNRVLRFGQTEQMTCTKSLNLAELKTYCESASW